MRSTDRVLMQCTKCNREELYITWWREKCCSMNEIERVQEWLGGFSILFDQQLIELGFVSDECFQSVITLNFKEDHYGELLLKIKLIFMIICKCY